ncbi:hypothetical protein AB4349_02345, partial [Vibrio breoganii]
IKARDLPPSHLSKSRSTQSKWVLDEPFLPSPSGSALLGINTQQIATKITSKGQQILTSRHKKSEALWLRFSNIMLD